MAGNFYPFDSSVANDLIAQWQNSSSQNKPLAPRELIKRISNDAITDPLEHEYMLLNLQSHQILKRKKFHRYFRSAKTFAWQQALQKHMPKRVEQIMDAVEGLLKTAGGDVAKSWQQTRMDLLLYAELTDNFNEDGFISVGLQVVQRILGDFDKKPENLVLSVAYAEYLDEQYKKFSEKLI